MSAAAATVAERQASAEVEEGECTTPTAAECRIPEATSCPPAPKKPKPRRSAVQTAAPPASDKAFFIPPNLEAVFAVRQAY